MNHLIDYRQDGIFSIKSGSAGKAGQQTSRDGKIGKLVKIPEIEPYGKKFLGQRLGIQHCLACGNSPDTAIKERGESIFCGSFVPDCVTIDKRQDL